MRSESWHVFWIGSERLREMEHSCYLHIGMGGGVMMRAGGGKKRRLEAKVRKVEPWRGWLV